MDCPICSNCFNLSNHRPIQLPPPCDCKMPLCHACALDMFKLDGITCPVCNTAVPTINEVADLKEHPDLLAQLHEEHRQSHAICSFHPGRDAERICSIHLVPLCEDCVCAESCKLEPLRPYPGKAQHFLKEGMRKAVEHLGGEDSIPYDLRENYDDIFVHQHTVQELLKLYKSLHRDKLLCRICFNDRVEAVDISDMELYCANCSSRLSTVLAIMPLSEITGISLVEYTRQHLQKISFWHLNRAQLCWLNSRPTDVLASLQTAKDIVALKTLTPTEPKDHFLCPRCLGLFYKEDYFLLQFPCPEAIHALCQDCSVNPECPLDGSKWDVSNLIPISQITRSSGGGDEETELRQRDGKYADSSDPTKMLSPTPRKPPATRVCEGHELCERGIPIPPFSSSFPDERLQVWERYLRVLPENPLYYQKGTFEEPWYVNRHSSQIEALTFRCFRTVWLRGVSLANPLEQGKVVNVVSATLHEGNKALGRGDPCDCLNRELQGDGGRVLTDIYFSEGKLLQQGILYTLKLKLLGANPAEKIAIYHGNHIGRYEGGQSSDGTAWNCEPTAGVDKGEKNSGQHELLSPILKLIYSD